MDHRVEGRGQDEGGGAEIRGEGADVGPEAPASSIGRRQ